MYLVFICMPGESYPRWFRSLLCLCDVFWASVDSLCFWIFVWLIAHCKIRQASVDSHCLWIFDCLISQWIGCATSFEHWFHNGLFVWPLLNISWLPLFVDFCLCDFTTSHKHNNKDPSHLRELSLGMQVNTRYINSIRGTSSLVFFFLWSFRVLFLFVFFGGF